MFLSVERNGQMGYYCLIQRGGHPPGREGNHLPGAASTPGQIRRSSVKLQFSTEGAWRKQLGASVPAPLRHPLVPQPVDCFCTEIGRD